MLIVVKYNHNHLHELKSCNIFAQEINIQALTTTIDANTNEQDKGGPMNREWLPLVVGLPFFLKNMVKTTERFIEESKQVHKNKYDYSKTVYVNNYTKVCIICPEHGEFWQRPNDHLRGRGCKVCSGHTRALSQSSYAIYKIWIKMRSRCTSESYKKQRPTYIGCSVCNEWQDFDCFLEWASERYIDGWQIDKDILVKGNKIYSPQTCCFVPQRINTLFTKRQRQRGKLPIGVCNSGKRFRGELQKGEKKVKLKSRETISEAFSYYKSAKESYIKEIADEYKEQLEPRVYEAMYNYKVEITD